MDENSIEEYAVNMRSKSCQQKWTLLLQNHPMLLRFAEGKLGMSAKRKTEMG